MAARMALPSATRVELLGPGAESRRTTAGSAGSSIRSAAPLDGRPLLSRRRCQRPLRGRPAARRRAAAGLGARLETGIAVFNTLLPLVRGQRIGLFAGSGVGKSTLLAKFARGVSTPMWW